MKAYRAAVLTTLLYAFEIWVDYSTVLWKYWLQLNHFEYVLPLLSSWSQVAR